MIREAHSELKPRYGLATIFLPPAGIEEAAWDILLALGSDDRCELTLDQLARLVSLPEAALIEWLAVLEGNRLVAGVRNEITNEVRAVLTTGARELLDRYLSAASDLQVTTRH